MKTIIVLLFVFTIGLLTTSPLKAQGFGLGLALGTGLEGFEGNTEVGLGVLASYSQPINSTFRYAFDVVFYFPSSEEFDFLGTTITSSILQFEINANTHYIFNSSESSDFYGIGGFQYAYKTVILEFVSNNEPNNDNPIGLNLGAGANFNMGSSKLFTELKYTVGGLGQLQIAAGIRF